MIALRGLPNDIGGGREMGARNWGWPDVLPTFQAMTNDLDEPVPQAQRARPEVVRRLPRQVWPLYMRRLEEAADGARQASQRISTPLTRTVSFSTPLSHDDERATSARCYLTRR